MHRQPVDGCPRACFHLRHGARAYLASMGQARSAAPAKRAPALAPFAGKEHFAGGERRSLIGIAKSSPPLVIGSPRCQVVS
jgi:hypothetical protein